MQIRKKCKIKQVACCWQWQHLCSALSAWMAVAIASHDYPQQEGSVISSQKCPWEVLPGEGQLLKLTLHYHAFRWFVSWHHYCDLHSFIFPGFLVFYLLSQQVHMTPYRTLSFIAASYVFESTSCIYPAYTLETDCLHWSLSSHLPVKPGYQTFPLQQATGEQTLLAICNKPLTPSSHKLQLFNLWYRGGLAAS